MNETTKVLKSHTTIRKFNDEKITLEEETEIIECALRGATAGNMMQYSIIKVRNKELLSKLAVLCDNQPFIANCDLGLIFLADTNKYETFFTQRGIKEEFKDYNGATSADLILALQDCIIAAQNSVICAESLNIGTCYIGDIIENAEKIKAIFNIPNGVIPISFVVYGKFDTKPALKNRFSKEFVVFEDKYPKVDENFINKMFAEEEKNTEDFARKFYLRKIAPPFFKEMIRSANIYLKHWVK